MFSIPQISLMMLLLYTYGFIEQTICDVIHPNPRVRQNALQPPTASAMSARPTGTNVPGSGTFAPPTKITPGLVEEGIVERVASVTLVR